MPVVFFHFRVPWFRLFSTVLCSFVAISSLFPLVLADSEDGTIDPNAVDEQYAWSDNVGWINFEVSDPAAEIHITDAGFTGYSWSQNYGWINMNPTGSGVQVAADGTLSGQAWGLNTGYIDFSGVQIDDEGYFNGTATGPIVGTLNFDCDDCVVRTDYRPDDFQSGAGPSGSSGRRRNFPDEAEESSTEDEFGQNEDVDADADDLQGDDSGNMRSSADQRDSASEFFSDVEGVGAGADFSLPDCQPGELERDIQQIQGSIAAFEKLFSWVYADDYHVTPMRKDIERTIENLYYEKAIIQALGEQVCSYVPFEYNKPEQIYLENLAELSKAFVLSFRFCFAEEEVLAAIQRDAEGGLEWWEEYDALLTPFWNYYFQEVYSELDGLEGKLMTKIVNSLLLDYCPNAQ